MSEPVFFNPAGDNAMEEVSEAARRTFKYFWRELSWERRRIIPALDMDSIKLRFTDGPRTDGNPDNEVMWLNQVDFDGITLTGTLVNQPNYLTSVKKGDFITSHFSYLTDWMITCGGKAYGGFTVNLLRSRMNPAERAAHDQAWGVDFGDPSEIRIDQSHPDKRTTLIGTGLEGDFWDHKMCVSVLPKYDAQMQSDPAIATAIDERGWILLHTEALAGNLGMVKLLIKYGADPAALTPEGWNAAGLAQAIGWDEIAAFLTNPTG